METNPLISNLDPFRVPDPEYEVTPIQEFDRFVGYRALEANDFILWQQAILDAEA
jgi:hypothetical protein